MRDPDGAADLGRVGGGVRPLFRRPVLERLRYASGDVVLGGADDHLAPAARRIRTGRRDPGAHPVPNSPLPWTGDYVDGLGNKIRMLAYANPENRQDETKRSDGYGIARFNKRARTVTFECWPRNVDVTDPKAKQYPGWPLTIKQQDNYGRQAVAWLPTIKFW